MKEVTIEEYHAHFMHKDAVLSLHGNWPYTSEWRMRGSGKLLAKCIETDKDENGQTIYPTLERYFIYE